MSKSFNLLDQPWLPVCLHDGRVCDLGLLELFERAGEIGALAETAPPRLIAQYRLLLAIVHRALSRAQGRWTDADRARWYRQGLPVEAVRDYLEHWRERFWLFHPEQPFMQVAALAEAAETRDRHKPWSQISLASANGNAPVVFDHSCDLAPCPIAPADALRTLLGFLQFTPGGLVKVLRDADKAGALANTAALMPLGESLAQSLCLALHPPTQAGHEDLPSWERDSPGLAQLRGEPTLASGPNDRYSRLTRAVLLLPDEQGKVQWIRFAAGIALAEDAQAPDPMASYRAGSHGLVRLSFAEGRALWRDLPALLPDAGGQASQPAAVLGWAANLQFLLGGSEQPVLVAGLASDQAKLLRWRSERIGLPAVLLASVDCANELRRQLQRAEALFGDMRRLAVGMLAETLPDSAGKDSWAKARNLFDASPAAALYFATAERALGRLMTLLGSGDLDQAEALWQRTLLAAVQVAWQAVCDGLGRSPGALRAEARAYPRLLARLTPLRSVKNTPCPHRRGGPSMSDHAQRFIAHLESLHERDRGALAVLRRSLGFVPGAYPPAYPHVEPFVAAERHARDASRLALYVVAGLYALHPRQGGKSLAACLGELMRQRDGAGIEQRFISLLGADAENLAVYLRQVISLLATGDLPVDYAALLRDLHLWLDPWIDPERRDVVRQRWARDFYRVLAASAGEQALIPAND